MSRSQSPRREKEINVSITWNYGDQEVTTRIQEAKGEKTFKEWKRLRCSNRIRSVANAAENRDLSPGEVEHLADSDPLECLIETFEQQITTRFAELKDLRVGRVDVKMDVDTEAVEAAKSEEIIDRAVEENYGKINP